MARSEASQRVYDAYLERVLDLMKTGTAPWHRPWTAGAAPSNLASGKPYRGVNAQLLGMVAVERGSPWFLTYRQAQARGGQVRAGSRGIPVVYWEPTTYTAKGADGEDEERRGLISRVYHVFSVVDVDGIDHLIPTTRSMPRDVAPNHDAERLALSVKPTPAVRFGGDRAYYSPALDYVQMPDVATFESIERYWATFYHELTHWTGHPSRLARGLEGMAPFGSYHYSREELVAEMGAGLICATLGIENAVVEQSAAYLRSWYEGIKRNPSDLTWAAAQAQKAADYILANWQTPSAANGENVEVAA